MRTNVATAFSRFVRLRCPVCGQTPIVGRPFHIRHHCPTCRALFKREEGFFVGALAISLVMTEALILVLYLLSLPLLASQFAFVLACLLAVAVLFPIAFYHHSWSAWLTLDHLIEKLPTASDETK